MCVAFSRSLSAPCLPAHACVRRRSAASSRSPSHVFSYNKPFNYPSKMLFFWVEGGGRKIVPTLNSCS